MSTQPAQEMEEADNTLSDLVIMESEVLYADPEEDQSPDMSRIKLKHANGKARAAFIIPSSSEDCDKKEEDLADISWEDNYKTNYTSQR